MAVDPSELRYYEDDDTPTMKTIKGATTGFVAGTIWGTVVATWYDVPRVERSVAIPGLVRTLKMMGNYGMTFAAIGGVYIGVEQLLQNYRMKRDFVNGAVGGFVAGASILGFKGINFIQSARLSRARLDNFELKYVVIKILELGENKMDCRCPFMGFLIYVKLNQLWPLVMLRVMYFLGRSISTAISAGSALAFTSAVIDAGGQTTRLDTGKEYYPYTTKKRPVES
ncbi:hypothetical protein Gogos_018508 [Gossypium gossypioides]|uniref:Outer envelope pore protein 16-3, chloroplastic/mitochondrial n=1 Tax=Gossypium gossypioides TaxID=34282 RepID=A0A7J9BED3_GOSGO|nr:hypothetical protein [Gossypium gossypioides]